MLISMNVNVIFSTLPHVKNSQKPLTILAAVYL